MTTILITGATDGIGLALAKIYSRRADHLILVSRRPLSALTDPLFTVTNYCQADLADEHCTAELSAWLHQNDIRQIDLVIHNAGVGYVGAIAEQPPDKLRSLIQVNLWSPIALSHMLFPLVERVRGKFVYITSVATAFPGPEYAVYTATKVALEGFVRSWQVELAADQNPVQLQIVRPGATRTNMHAKSGADPTKLRSDRFPTAEQIAARIVAAMEHPKRTTTIGMVNQVVYHAATIGARLVDSVMHYRQRQLITTKAHGMKADGAPHCVITGAADGIGRAVTEALAVRGYRITGIDIDQERSAALQQQLTEAGHDVHFIVADLAALDKLPTLLEQLQARPPINLLIHNAGISAVGAFHECNLARQRAVLDVNFVTPFLLTSRLLQEQRMASQATFVFISSLSHFTSYPGAAVYAATKAGVASYARSLAVAVAPHQHVLTVYPGPTRTAHARRYSPDNRREMQRMAPTTLAAYLVSAIQSQQRILIPGAMNWGAALLGQLLPTVAEQLMRRTIYDKLPRNR
ncbi:MAG: SDR family NAD(P)-dependent oxidoreductase [Caldilineaceae bacterium]|nr:SDR family NAD(P)-dependent oxidoreductase [Caldilineaceae bacterium]